MARTYALKNAIRDEIARTSDEISKLKDYIANGQNADLKVCYTRLTELEQHIAFVEKINRICVDRNKY